MTKVPIVGAELKDLVRHEDGRGFFEEVIRASDPFFVRFAQFSWCRRNTGTVTAWHFHPTQWDWWFVPHGRIKAVLHDLRADSPTRGTTYEVFLGEGTPDRVLAIRLSGPRAWADKTALAIFPASNYSKRLQVKLEEEKALREEFSRIAMQP